MGGQVEATMRQPRGASPRRGTGNGNRPKGCLPRDRGIVAPGEVVATASTVAARCPAGTGIVGSGPVPQRECERDISILLQDSPGSVPGKCKWAGGATNTPA